MWDNKQLLELLDPAWSVLDLGCHEGMSFRNIVINRVTVDIWEDVKADVRWNLQDTPYPFFDNSYDCVVALDVIEHLKCKAYGSAMIREMERIARERMIVFTAIEFKTNEDEVERTGNEWNRHHALWGPEDFEGWEVIEHVLGEHNFYVKDL